MSFFFAIWMKVYLTDDRSLGNVDEVLLGLESDLLDTESVAGSVQW